MPSTHKTECTLRLNIQTPILRAEGTASATVAVEIHYREEDVTCNARSGRKKNVHRKKCRLTSLYCQRMKSTIQLFPAQIANCQMKRNSQCVICIITCLICLLDGLDETLPWHGDYLMKALLDSLQISKANLSLSDLACSSLGRANKAKKSRSFGSCCSGSSSRTEKYKQIIRNESDRLVNMY